MPYGKRYPLVGGTRLAVEIGKNQSREKAQKRAAHSTPTARIV